ncbi:MAG: co-chaperone DjlA [Gammaproteobacteria bacterium]
MANKLQRLLSANGWWGKVIGGLLGLAVKGPVGALVGAVVGHQVDRGYARVMSRDEPEELDSAISDEFFAATFAVMGHVAKSDGRVSERDIALARDYMQRLDLDEQRRREAIRQFTFGKSAHFPLDKTMASLSQTLGKRERLKFQFIEIQVEAMLADRKAHPKTRELLWRICESLGVGRVDLAQMEAAAHARRGGFVERGSVDEAYKVLGVEASVDDKVLKTAYRRLMNRHHPDKLMAKGLPQEMMNQARAQTQAIQSAYETVKTSRGLT